MTKMALNETGLTLPRLEEIVAYLCQKYKEIYGAAINLESYSPDGQRIRIEAQLLSDVIELLRQIYGSFDVEQAGGVALDRLVAINGLARQAGSYSEIMLTLTLKEEAVLNGLDSANPLTVSNSSGNLSFKLIKNVSLAAGQHKLSFRSVESGAIHVPPATLINVQNKVAAITAVTNEENCYLIGTEEESDVQLRLRRSRSVNLGSTAFIEALEAALADSAGVSFVRVYENSSNLTNEWGMPPHSIWPIVAGGDDLVIAQIIDQKRHIGAAMYGQISQIVESRYHTGAIKFDRPKDIVVNVRVTLSLLGPPLISADSLKNYLVTNCKVGIYEAIDITAISKLIKTYAPNVVVEDCALSRTANQWHSFLKPQLPVEHFRLSENAIVINGL